MELVLKTPEALWGLLLVGAAWGLLLWNRSRDRRYFSWRRAFLYTMGLACIVVALSRPQFGTWETDSHGSDAALFVAMDVSQSMLAQDVPPSRLGFSRAFVQKLLMEIPSLRVALFPFALDGFLQIPLTTDLYAFQDVLLSLHPDVVTFQGTDLTRALQGLLLHIRRYQEKRLEENKPTLCSVVLLSDGETHAPLDNKVLKEFRSHQVPIFTVASGTVAGSTITLPIRGQLQWESYRGAGARRVHTQLHPEVLRTIAEETDGEYFAAQFDEVFRLGARIKRNTQNSQLVARFDVNREGFPLLLLAGLLLWLIDLCFGRWEYAIRLLIAGLFIAAGSPTPAFATEDGSPKLDADPERRAIQLYNLGLEQLKAQDAKKAAESFGESALLTQDAVVRRRALYNLGNTYLRLNDPLAALEAYQQSRDTKVEKEAQAELTPQISENMDLAWRVYQMAKKNPSSGDGDPKDSQPNDSQDPGKAKTNFQDQNLTEKQKEQLFALTRQEDQEIQQRLEAKKQKRSSPPATDKPW